MPKENRPRSGPPTMPNMLSAAYKNNTKSTVRNLKPKHNVLRNFIRVGIEVFSLLQEKISKCYSWQPCHWQRSLITGNFCFSNLSVFCSFGCLLACLFVLRQHHLSPGCPRAHCIDKSGLQLTGILRPLPPKCAPSQLTFLPP